MPITPRSRYTIKAGRLGIGKAPKARKLRSDVFVVRTGNDGAKAFEACVEIGSMLPGWRAATAAKRASGYTTSCMFGKNPRAALAAALARASRQMKKRSGAFAAFGGK